jgi:hypothetical protein
MKTNIHYKKLVALFFVLLVVIITGIYLRKMGIIQENFTKHGRGGVARKPKNG